MMQPIGEFFRSMEAKAPHGYLVKLASDDDVIAFRHLSGEDADNLWHIFLRQKRYNYALGFIWATEQHD